MYRRTFRKKRRTKGIDVPALEDRLTNESRVNCQDCLERGKLSSEREDGGRATIGILKGKVSKRIVLIIRGKKHGTRISEVCR